MMMLLLRPPAAQRATGLRQQPARNRTDNGGRLLSLARRTALKDQRNSGLVCFCAAVQLRGARQSMVLKDQQFRGRVYLNGAKSSRARARGRG